VSESAPSAAAGLAGLGFIAPSAQLVSLSVPSVILSGSLKTVVLSRNFGGS